MLFILALFFKRTLGSFLLPSSLKSDRYVFFHWLHWAGGPFNLEICVLQLWNGLIGNLSHFLLVEFVFFLGLVVKSSRLIQYIHPILASVFTCLVFSHWDILFIYYPSIHSFTSIYWWLTWYIFLCSMQSTFWALEIK